MHIIGEDEFHTVVRQLCVLSGMTLVFIQIHQSLLSRTETILTCSLSKDIRIKLHLNRSLGIYIVHRVDVHVICSQ